MKVDAAGKAKGIEGYSELMDAMCKKMTEFNPEAGSAMEQMLKESYSQEKIMDMTNGMYANFPDGKVKVGDKWNTVTSMGGSQFPIDLDVTCVLKDCSKTVATIGMVSKMDTGTGDGKVIEANGMKMNMVFSGTMDGFSKVDRKTGWLLESQTNQAFSGSMKLAPNPQMPDGMTIPMSIKGKVTLKSEKLN